jgi:hypothetical protein
MNNLPFPYMPSRSTAIMFESFDPAVFTKTTSSTLYNFLDALVGKTGAGSLLNQIFLSNLSAAIDTCYFNELDYIVGNIRFLARSTAESYTYNPLADQLTSDEWDEVRVKDAWFRARIKDFFAACQLGGTPEGIKKCVSAAIASDCTIQEVWRYVDNFDIDGFVGRSEATRIPTHYAVINLKTGFEVLFSDEDPADALAAANNFKTSRSPSSDWEVRAVNPRNEVVVKPHKKSLKPNELRLLRELLGRLLPIETIITVDLEGLAVSTPVPISGAASDSSYYEVIKQVIPSPLISQMPPPEFLPIDLLPGEQWLFKKDPPKGFFGSLLDFLNGPDSDKREAKSGAFQQTAQHSYYYLASGGKTSAIDSITYGTLQSDGSVKSEQNYRLYQQNSSYTGWIAYQKADSPDNFPGGQFGQHPGYGPALNPDGTPYSFPYTSQASYVNEMIVKITGLGGVANENHYKLPIQKNQTLVYSYFPEYAVANFPPTKESTVSASLTRQRPRTLGNSMSDSSNFVR